MRLVRIQVPAEVGGGWLRRYDEKGFPGEALRGEAWGVDVDVFGVCYEVEVVFLREGGLRRGGEGGGGIS